MSITTKEGILKVLTAYNSWWKTGIVNPKMSKHINVLLFMKQCIESRKKTYGV